MLPLLLSDWPIAFTLVTWLILQLSRDRLTCSSRPAQIPSSTAILVHVDSSFLPDVLGTTSADIGLRPALASFCFCASFS